jgi:hypothetical protein
VSRYVQKRDGDVISLGHGRRTLIECCDCGLVHLLRFKLTGGKQLSFQAWRLNRETAQRRRYRGVGPK